MRLAVLLVVLLSFAGFCFAQNAGGGATASSPGQGGQPVTGPAATAPTGNMGSSATQPGGAGAVAGTPAAQFVSQPGTTFLQNVPVGSAPGYVPLLQTPIASWPSPISTPGTQAGITDYPQGRLIPADAPGIPGIVNAGASGGFSSQPQDTRSLGQIAAEYRQRKQTQQASRVFTNADIARLNQGQQPMGTEIGPGGASVPQGGEAQSPTTPSVAPGQPQGQSQAVPGSDVPAPERQQPPPPNPQKR